MNEIQVLLAEDNRADVILVKEALAAHDVPHQLHLVKDGEEAVDFITRMGTPGEPPCPDVFLLDLNLPKIDGIEILQEFRRHPLCVSTPVIVISSSDAPRDREKASGLNVTRYFRKPTTLDGFMKLGEVVKEVVLESGGA
jgi:CheY-like chemotaxis protein